MPSKKKLPAEKPAFSGGHPSAHLEKRTKLRQAGLKGGKLQDALEQQLAAPASKAKRVRKFPSTAEVVAGGLRQEEQAAAEFGKFSAEGCKDACSWCHAFLGFGAPLPNLCPCCRVVVTAHEAGQAAPVCSYCACTYGNHFVWCRPLYERPYWSVYAVCSACSVVLRPQYLEGPQLCPTCRAVAAGYQAGQAEAAAVLAAEGIELPLQSRPADLSKLLVRVPPPEPHAGGMREFTANRTRAAVYLRLPLADLQAIEAARAVQAQELEAAGVQPALEAAV